MMKVITEGDLAPKTQEINYLNVAIEGDSIEELNGLDAKKMAIIAARERGFGSGSTGISGAIGAVPLPKKKNESQRYVKIFQVMAGL
jgi:hypothetical protein